MRQGSKEKRGAETGNGCVQCSWVGVSHCARLAFLSSTLLLTAGKGNKKREDAEFKEREGEAYTVGTAI